MEKCPKCSCEDKIGIEIRGVYDGILFWRCQHCRTDYHRWTDPHMQKKAERHMNQKEKR